MTDSQFLIKMADSTKVTPFKIRLRKIARFIAEVEQFDVEDGVRKLRETLKKGKHANEHDTTGGENNRRNCG